MGVKGANVKVCEADEIGKSLSQNLTSRLMIFYFNLHVIQLVTFVTKRISYEIHKELPEVQNFA